MNIIQLIKTRLSKKIESRRSIVVIANEKIPVKPIDTETALQIFVLIAPYIPFLEKHIPEFKKALSTRTTDRPQLLSSVIKTLFNEMRDTPGLTVKILALLIDHDPEWIARNITPKQFVEAFIVLDRVNGFYELIELIRAFGVEVKYAIDSDLDTDSV